MSLIFRPLGRFFRRRLPAVLAVAVLLPWTGAAAQFTPNSGPDGHPAFPELLIPAGLPRSDRSSDSGRDLRQLREQARSGVPEAQTRLGLLYQTGDGLPFPRPRAGFRLLLEAAEAGYPRAMLHVAEAYEKGRGTRAHPESAFQWLERLAALDLSDEGAETDQWLEFAEAQTEALNRLGTRALKDGDAATALKHWNKGADLGDLTSTLNSARLLALGNGGEADFVAASARLEAARRHVASRIRRAAGEYLAAGIICDAEVYLLEREAVNQSDTLAGSMQMMIGQELVDRGKGPDDVARGSRWFRLAAESGNGLAAARLGMLYLDGRDDLVERDAALAYLQAAAADDIWVGQHALAVFFDREGHPGEADQWFRRAATNGFYLSQRALQEPEFRRPFLFSENLTELIHASELGKADAAYYRGLYHWIGVGLEENAGSAEKWFEKAADAGHAGAQYYRALAAFSGELPGGSTLTTEEAIRLLEASGASGYAPALVLLGRLQAAGLDGEHLASAESYLRSALALEPDGEANLYLALLLEADDPPPWSEIVPLLVRAADSGEVTAMSKLGDLARQGLVPDDMLSDRAAEQWYLRAIDHEEDADALYGIAEVLRARPRAEEREILMYLERAALQGHTEAAAIVAEAYRDGAGADHRPTVAARFYLMLVEHGHFDHMADLGRMLLATNAQDDLERVLDRAEAFLWDIKPEVADYFRGYLDYHRDRPTKRQAGLARIVMSAKAGFPDAEAFLLRRALDDPQPDEVLEAILASVDLELNPEGYFYKGRLLYEQPERFGAAQAEGNPGLAMMQEAAEHGCIEAMCYLDDLRRKAIQGAPSREQLMDWLSPYADRGFETAIRRLRSIHAEDGDETETAPQVPDVLARFGEELTLRVLVGGESSATAG